MEIHLDRYTFCSHLEMDFDELPLHNAAGFEVARLPAVKVSVEYELQNDGTLGFDLKSIEVRQYGHLEKGPHRAYGECDWLERPIYDTLTDKSRRYYGEIIEACRADAEDAPETQGFGEKPTPQSEYVLL
jgi:hypothetical protein